MSLEACDNLGTETVWIPVKLTYDSTGKQLFRATSDKRLRKAGLIMGSLDKYKRPPSFAGEALAV